MQTSQYSYITNYNIYPEYIEYVNIDNNNISIQKHTNINTQPFDIATHLHYTHTYLAKELSPDLSYNTFKHAWKDSFTFYNYQYEYDTPIIINTSIDDTSHTTNNNDDIEIEDNESLYYSSSSDEDESEWSTI